MNIQGTRCQYRDAELSKEIHPADQMWLTGKDWYFSVGKDGLEAVLRALSLSWLERVSAILDLPCGHGRVARHLRAAFPDIRMFFCDIDQSGVDFCANSFLGTPITSKPELTTVPLPNVDVIWVGSLFTHVDLDRTKRWLAYLAEHLNEHGVLVATFHGGWSIEEQKTHPMIDSASWAEIMRQYDASGFGFARYSHTDLSDLGVSLAKPSKVIDIASAIEGVRIIGYMERGWADNHDVLMLTKNDRVALRGAPPRNRVKPGAVGR